VQERRDLARRLSSLCSGICACAERNRLSTRYPNPGQIKHNIRDMETHERATDQGTNGGIVDME